MKKLGLIVTIFLSTIFIGCGGGSASSGNGDNSSVSDRIKWNYNVGSETYVYYSSIALSTDNQTLYVGTSVKDHETASGSDKLIALNRNGTLKWKYDLLNGEEVRSSPVVSNGKVLFVADKRTAESNKEYTDLFCINEIDGSLVWKQRISNNTNMSTTGKTVVTVKDNKVFAVMKYIYAFNINDGTELYKSTQLQSNDKYINPIISQNQLKFILNEQLYSVNADTYDTSTLDLSNILTGADVFSSFAVDNSNNLYFGTENGKVISLDNLGNKNWEYSLGSADNYAGPYFRSSPAIDESHGVLYIGTKDNENSKLLSIKLSDGTLNWSFFVGGDVYSSPTIGNNGNIYIGSETSNIHAINPDGQLVWKVGVNQEITWPSPTIDNEGVLYIGGMGDMNGGGNGKVYAIQTDSTGLSTESWPTVHYNSQNNAVK